MLSKTYERYLKAEGENLTLVEIRLLWKIVSFRILRTTCHLLVLWFFCHCCFRWRSDNRCDIYGERPSGGYAISVSKPVLRAVVLESFDYNHVLVKILLLWFVPEYHFQWMDHMWRLSARNKLFISTSLCYFLRTKCSRTVLYSCLTVQVVRLQPSIFRMTQSTSIDTASKKADQKRSPTTKNVEEVLSSSGGQNWWRERDLVPLPNLW